MLRVLGLVKNGQYRIFELAVGAQLLQLPGELYYWRENNLEVDFIYRNQKTLYAIEVKSGRRKSSKGPAAFQKQFPDARPVVLTTENFSQFSEDPLAFLALL